MIAKRMENWDAGDFCRSFRNAATNSSDERFRAKFHTLADALEPMDREFCRETAGCGRDLGSTIEELHGIAGRMNYCSSDRGYEQECQSLYQAVDAAVSHVESLRQSCFV